MGATGPHDMHDAPAENPPRRSGWQRWLRPTADERRRKLAREVRVVTVVAIAVLAYGWLWPVDLRRTETARIVADLVAFMVRTFQLHIGLFLLLVACVAWRLKLYRWLALLTVAAAVALLPTLRGMLPTRAGPPVGDTLRVVSVNLYANNRAPAQLISELLASNADVILTQEYTPAWQAHLAPRLTASGYAHAVETPQEDCFGAALFSRRPFVEVARSNVPLGPAGNAQLRAVVELAGQHIALYNVHLLPPANLEYVRTNRAEFCDLEEVLRNETLPAIVCGDFNFTQDSAQADRLRAAGFRDALDHAGRGPRWTWPVSGPLRYVPGLRLDHVYLRGLHATDARTGVGHGSDHRPVIADVACD